MASNRWKKPRLGAKARASYRPVRHMRNFMVSRPVAWLLQYVHAPREVVSKLHLFTWCITYV